jgi:hypothetical protein
MIRYQVNQGFKKTKNRLKTLAATSAATIAGLTVVVAMPLAAHAEASQVIVTPTDTQGWSTVDTNAGGDVNFVSDSTAPGDPSKGALQLKTDLTTTAKAQYMHASTTPLADVTELSYSTKQNSPAGPVADAAYQLPVFLNGGTSGFSTLVYEPYQNPTQGIVTNGVWQNWDVDQGLFWSTRTVTCSNGTILGTPGGPATYTLDQVNAICPNAVTAGFGVNIGSNNPGYDVEADLVNFNGTTYNFEPFKAPSNKDDCKKGGYKNLTDQNGNPFRNQGQCVSWTNGRGQ